MSNQPETKKARSSYFNQALRLLEPRQRVEFASISLLKIIVGVSDVILAGILYGLFLILQQGGVPYSHSPLGRLLPSSFEGVALCCLAVMLFRLGGEIVCLRWLTSFSQRVYTHFILSLLGHYAAMSWATYVTRNRSELLKHCLTTSQDVGYTYQLLIELLSSVSIVVCLLIAAAWQAPVPALVIGVLVTCLLFTQGKFARTVLDRVAALRESHHRRLHIAISETLQLQKEIRVYKAAAFFKSRVEKHAEEVRVGNTSLGNLPQMSRAFIEHGAMIAFMTMILILYSGSNVTQLISMLVFYFVLARRMLPNVGQILMIAGQIDGALHNTRLLESELSSGTTADQPLGHMASKAGPVIRLENVGFAYRHNEPVLRDITFDIHAGEIVVLRGPSGAGKSSLLNLVCGLLHPTSGTVSLGNDSKVAYVPQEVMILDGSIRENITFGSAVRDDAQIFAALRTSQLAEFVLSLPKGIDTPTGDNGVLFSGGQRQRLGIARALFQNPGLLLLDESTAGIDAENERRLFECLRRDRPGIAILFVTHRPFTAIGADRVICLQEGRLIEDFIGLREAS